MARGYLHPAMERDNLTVMTGALGTGCASKANATGVEVEHKGGMHTINAGEVILSGGAINHRSCCNCPGSGSARTGTTRH